MNLEDEFRKRAATERADNWCNTEDAPIWRSIHQHRAEVYENCADMVRDEHAQKRCPKCSEPLQFGMPCFWCDSVFA